MVETQNNVNLYELLNAKPSLYKNPHSYCLILRTLTEKCIRWHYYVRSTSDKIGSEQFRMCHRKGLIYFPRLCRSDTKKNWQRHNDYSVGSVNYLFIHITCFVFHLKMRQFNTLLYHYSSYLTRLRITSFHSFFFAQKALWQKKTSFRKNLIQ